MFNNSNSQTNGEKYFYEKIKPHINVIFDVGSNEETLFLDFKGEVHYFEPVEKYLINLSKKENKNQIMFLNSFGLGNENVKKDFYLNYHSFNDRIKGLPGRVEEKIVLDIKKAKDYINEKNIQRIDFLKIDTEGFDFEVIKGFEDKLSIVQIIQFEYGGCCLEDKSFKLNEIIKYLEKMNFCKFSYLTEKGRTELSSLKGGICETNPGHRNGSWSSLDYPEKVKFIEDDGHINDHYNYCNVVCVNKNSDLIKCF